ncbi:MAG: DUF2442 domain-containing protein [Ardenticatenales bacterium]|nr:DUF2442 domain-containing protein [Ardenticatenales bacterium]
MPRMMILHVTQVQAPSHYQLDLTFNNGTRKRVNVQPLVWGPVFEPLREPNYFAQVTVVYGTVAWPNGADIAPEALYELPDEGRRATTEPAEVSGS